MFFGLTVHLNKKSLKSKKNYIQKKKKFTEDKKNAKQLSFFFFASKVSFYMNFF